MKNIEIEVYKVLIKSLFICFTWLNAYFLQLNIAAVESP